MQKHLTDFPQPEDLCDYHRLVYHDHKPNPSPKQVAGAAAFEVRDCYVFPCSAANIPHNDTNFTC